MVFGAGVARRTSYFLLLAQEKVTKEKSTPVGGLPLVGSLPLLAGSGGPLKLARSAARPRAQTVACRLPPPRLRYSAPLRGPKSVAARRACVFCPTLRRKFAEKA